MAQAVDTEIKMIAGIYFLSFICYILSFLTESVLLLIISIPFLLFICAMIHEAGHCIGCYINSNKITRVVTPFLTYCDGKLGVANTISPKSYCSFAKGKNDSLVYILGPMMSLVFAVLSGLLYYVFGSSALMLLTIIAIIVFLINIIPGKNGDLTKYFNEKNK